MADTLCWDLFSGIGLMNRCAAQTRSGQREGKIRTRTFNRSGSTHVLGCSISRPRMLTPTLTANKAQADIAETYVFVDVNH